MRYQEFYLIFFIYSFLGWCWETFPCSAIELDKIHNRGFLLGPIIEEGSDCVLGPVGHNVGIGYDIALFIYDKTRSRPLDSHRAEKGVLDTFCGNSHH